MEDIEDNFDEKAHKKLLYDLKKLSGKSEKVRRERVVRISSDAKPSIKFGSILSRIGDHNLPAASRDLKPLPKPLEKPEAKRVKRAAGYEELAVDVNRWEGVVEQRRKAEQLEFPLHKADVRIITTERKYKPAVRTDLEKEIYQLIDGAGLEESEEETQQDKDIKKAMTLEDIRLKSKEDWRARVLRQRLLKKASMLNNSKSRKYRQILRRDRVKRRKEEFERLKTSDPEAALEALQQIERTRLRERMTLRHKNSRWLSGQGSRASRDSSAREFLKENTELRQELLKKLKPPEEDSSDGGDSKSEAEEEKIKKIQNVKEADEFSSYRKTWTEFYKKKLEESKRVKGDNKAGNGKGDDKAGNESTEMNSIKYSDVIEGEDEGDDVCERKTEEVDVNSNVVKDDDVRCSAESSDEKAVARRRDVKRKGNKSRLDGSVMKDISDAVKSKKLKKVKCKTMSDDVEVNVKKNKSGKRMKKKEGSEVIEKVDKSSNRKMVNNKVKDNKIMNGKDMDGSMDEDEALEDVTDNMNVDESTDESEEFEDAKENIEVDDVADDLFIEDMFHRAEEKVINKVGAKIKKLGKVMNEIRAKKIRSRKGREGGKDRGDAQTAGSDQNVDMEFDFTSKSVDSNIDERLTTSKTVDHQSNQGQSFNQVAAMVEGVARAVEVLGKDENNSKNDEQSGKKESSKSLVSLDHNEVAKIKSRRMGSTRSDESFLKRKLEEESSDSEVEAELQDIFDEEEISENIRDFKQAKKAAEEAAQPKDASIFQQGWGGWAGPGIAPKKNKTKKYRIKAPKRAPNKYTRVGNVIYNEKSDVHENIRKIMVSDLPHPYASVSDFEASIRQSTSRKFIPESAHQKLIAPPIITKMGTVIPPMDEEALLSSNKRHRGKSKLEESITNQLSRKSQRASRKTNRPAQRANKSHKKNKVKSLVFED